MDVEIAEIKNILKEVAIAQKEVKQMFKDTDAQFKETREMFKDTDIRFKETDAKIKKAFDLFEGQWGKLMESLVEGDIIRLLQARGIEVHDTSMRRKGSHEGQNFEFDIIAHNGNEIVIIEVKTTLRVNHVKSFIEKLKNAKTYLQEYKNYNIYGAIAFLKEEEASATFAASNELFVIRATGNSATIVNEPNFVPRIF